MQCCFVVSYFRASLLKNGYIVAIDTLTATIMILFLYRNLLRMLWLQQVLLGVSLYFFPYTFILPTGDIDCNVRLKESTFS